MESLIEAFDEKEIFFLLNRQDDVKALTFSKEKTSIQLVNVLLKQINLDPFCTYSEITAFAKDNGLKLLTLEMAFQLRLEYSKQSTKEVLFVPVERQNNQTRLKSLIFRGGKGFSSIIPDHDEELLCDENDRLIFCL